MPLLSKIFNVSQKQPHPPLMSCARDDRDSVRRDANIPVSIHPRGMPPVMGAVVNISAGGAAIHIYYRNNAATWLSHLEQGDELGLTGILDVPMSCWVVVFDDGVLRVHFASDGATQRRLREVIEMPSAPDLQSD